MVVTVVVVVVVVAVRAVASSCGGRPLTLSAALSGALGARFRSYMPPPLRMRAQVRIAFLWSAISAAELNVEVDKARKEQLATIVMDMIKSEAYIKDELIFTARPSPLCSPCLRLVVLALHAPPCALAPSMRPRICPPLCSMQTHLARGPCPPVQRANDAAQAFGKQWAWDKLVPLIRDRVRSCKENGDSEDSENKRIRIRAIRAYYGLASSFPDKEKIRVYLGGQYSDDSEALHAQVKSFESNAFDQASFITPKTVDIEISLEIIEGLRQVLTLRCARRRAGGVVPRARHLPSCRPLLPLAPISLAHPDTRSDDTRVRTRLSLSSARPDDPPDSLPLLSHAQRLGQT